MWPQCLNFHTPIAKKFPQKPPGLITPLGSWFKFIGTNLIMLG